MKGTVYFKGNETEKLEGAKLTIFEGNSEPVQVDLAAYKKDVITFGRDEGNDLCIRSNYVSRRHGQFRFAEGKCFVEDLGSKNGLLFQGQRLPGKLLEDGDSIRIDYGDTPTPGGVLIVFSCKKAEEEWETVSLKGKKVFTVGREETCDVVLNHVGVSRVHARIWLENSAAYMEDLGSRNGVWINGERLSGKRLLQEKDVIVITNSKLIFSAMKIRYCTFSSGIRVDAANIVKQVDDGKKTICDHVSLSIEPGELVAIIGGSGAGKSTIMNCISGYSKPTSGIVKVNGLELYQHFESMKNIIGYVPQQDIVFENLSLQNMLDYTARLRLPEDMSETEREQVIAKVIEQVELTERKDVLIKKLSGGQRKRASIAVELLSDPKLFFLDEPASGLDPGTERNLMRTLKEMTEHGKTVVFVTHSTLNLKMCDKIVFMGAGGKLCFCGSYDEAKTFFGVEDLVDVYNMITEDSDSWRQRYESVRGELRDVPQEVVRVHKKKVLHDRKQQMKVLVGRHMETLFNDRVRLLLILLQAPLLGLLISFVADGQEFEQYEMTKSLLFALSCSAFWIGTLNSIQEVCKERVILRREYMTGLRLDAYVYSKLLVMGMVCMVQSFLITTVFAILVGLPSGGVILPAYLELLLITFLTAWAASATGLFVSCLFKNADRAMTVAPILLMPQLLFSGQIFKLDGITEAISWFVTCRFSMEGYGTLADLNSLELRVQQELGREFGNVEQFIPHEAEQYFEYEAGHFLFAILMLLVFVAAFTVLARAALRRIREDR